MPSPGRLCAGLLRVLHPADGRQTGLERCHQRRYPADLLDLLKSCSPASSTTPPCFAAWANSILSADADNSSLRDRFVDRAAFDAWAATWRARLQQEPGSDSERKSRMDRSNPKYILRNHLAQAAIELAESIA